MTTAITRAGPYLPGISRVIGETLTSHERCLLGWPPLGPRTAKARVENTGGRKRGDELHALLRNHMLGRRDLMLSPAVIDRWAHVARVADTFQSPLWADGGITGTVLAGRSELVADGLRGCPDLLAYRGGRLQLVELKSGSTPMVRYEPQRDDPEYWLRRAGHLKLRLALEQLAGYLLLLEPLGIAPVDLVVLGSLPGRVQQFTVPVAEAGEHTAGFAARRERFAAMMEAEAKAVAAGVAMALRDMEVPLGA